MGEVINLNKFRKRRLRAEAERLADQNRVKHGRTQAEREAERLHLEKQERMLEQHWLLKAPVHGDGDDDDDDGR